MTATVPVRRLDPACRKIRSTRGLPAAVAKACGIKRQAIYQWERVPIERVHQIKKLIKMTPEEIRPDIFRGTGRGKGQQG